MSFEVLMLLLINIVIASLTFVFIKLFKKDAPIFYSAIRLMFMTVVFVIAFFVLGGLEKGINFSRILLFAGGAVSFVLCNTFSVLATREGPVSYTSLIFSFGLFIPTFFGVIFLNNTVGLFFWIGLALFVACLLLLNLEPKKTNDENKVKITLKWVIYVLIGTISNGIGSVLITISGKPEFGATNNAVFDGVVFLMVSCLVASIISGIVAFFKEREKINESKKSVLKLASLCGIFTAALYILILIFSNLELMPVAIYFPVYSGGQLIMCSLIGISCFKEKYRPLQYLGIVVGIVSVVLLNL